MDNISSDTVFFKKHKYPATQEVLKNEDLLRGIFSYIDASTMMRLSEVSKDWQKHVEAFARTILDSYSLNPRVSQFFKFPSFKKTAVGVIGEIYLGVRHLEKSQKVKWSPFPDLSSTIVADLTQIQRGKYIWDAGKLGYEETVELLLASGPFSQEDRGWAVLDISQNEDQRIVELLLDSGPICKASRGFAVVNAASNGRRGIVELLLANGPISKSDRSHAVWMAARKGYQGIVELLLANGSIFKRDRSFALKGATKNGHQRIVELLRSSLTPVPRERRL